MTRWFIAFVVVIVSALASVNDAAADRRVALVIGNGAYKSVPALPNPPNDGPTSPPRLSGSDLRCNASPTQASTRCGAV